MTSEMGEINIGRIQEILDSLREAGKCSVLTADLIRAYSGSFTATDPEEDQESIRFTTLLDRNRSLLGISRINPAEVVDDAGNSTTSSNWAIWHEE